MSLTNELRTALADRYVIDRQVGAGGMATVYLARDIKHERPVALKVLNPDLGAVLGVERFLSEIRVTANLQHPNLLPLFDSGAAEGLLFYVMPYVEGESLRAMLERERQLPVHTAVRIAVAVASALDHAHKRGVIHRDLKPENLLMQDGQPLVADFGIALAVSNAGGTRVTQTGISLGTPQYMSPEQATGDRNVDARTDVYSLAAILYEMLTGETPHSGATAQAIFARVLTERPRRVRSTREKVPAEVDTAIARALEKLPADRFASAGEFAAALEAGARAPAEPATPRRIRRSTLLWTAGAAIAALGAFLLGETVGSSDAGATSWQGRVLGAPPVAFQPRISPDGRLVAFTSMGSDGETQIGVTSTETGEWRIRTTARTLGNAEEPSWSLDGTRVYFNRYLDVPRGVYAVSVIDGEEQLILEDARAPQVLPDGSLLVSRLNPHVEQLFRYYPDTRRIDTLDATSSPNGFPNIQYRAFRDGKEVAFFGRPASDSSAADDIYALDLATNRTRILAPKIAKPPVTWAFQLTISGDDQWVIFAAPAVDLIELVAVPRNGSNSLKRLVNVTGIPLHLDAGADGALYVDQLDMTLEVVRYRPSTRRFDRLNDELGGFGSGNGVASLAPLPDGRVLVSTTLGGRQVVTARQRGKGPATFVATQEETKPPMSMLGPNRVILRIGSGSRWRLGVVELATGRIDAERTAALATVDARDINFLVGAVDGQTVYYVRAATVWAHRLDGGAPKRLHEGSEVAVDPDGTSLVVKVVRSGVVSLVRVRISDGRAQPIVIRDSLRIAITGLAGGAIARDGRIALRVSTTNSWFWPVGLLDPRTGLIEVPPPGFTEDAMEAAWAPDGSLLWITSDVASRLWKLEPARDRP